MFDIQPRTYNEALRLSRCLEIRKYAPNITDTILQEMYMFLSQHVNNKIGISNDGMIHFTNYLGTTTDAFKVEINPGFDHIVMSTGFFRVTNTATSGGDSGCGGCSSNNNNNNNNNNNG